MLSKTNKTNKLITPKKVLIVLLCALILIVIAISLETLGITHFINQPKNKADIQIQESSISTRDKKIFIENAPNNTNSDKTNNSLTASDITLSSKRENDGTITISTQLKNYSDGSCKLTIKNGSDTYTQTVPVIFQKSFSTCAGFNIPSNVVKAGQWQISLTVSSKDTVNTQSTTMEVHP